MSDSCSRAARLLRFAERVFHETTVERVLRPAIADLQHECAAAPGNLAVRLRAYWAVVKTMAVCFVGDAASDRDRTARSIAGRTALILPIVTTLLTLPSLSYMIAFGSRYGLEAGVLSGALLVAPTLVLSLPIAFFLAVALHRPRAGHGSPRLMPAGIAATAGCTALFFVLLMAIVPVVNQMYRAHLFNTAQRVMPAPYVELRPGLSEMNLLELNDRIRHAPSADALRQARAHRSLRLALSALPLILGFLALGITNRWRSRVLQFSVSLGLFLVYGTLFVLAANRVVPLEHAVWITNGAFLLIGLALIASRKEWRESRA